MLDGVDIRDIVYKEYVKLLAVVFQDFQLFAFTARENVTLVESFAKAEDMRKNEEKLREDYKGKKLNSWGTKDSIYEEENMEKRIVQ